MQLLNLDVFDPAVRDWDRERRVLDEQFRSVWKAIEDCKRPTTR